MDNCELEKVGLSGGRRLNVNPSEWQEEIWIVHGKDDSCQAEASWDELVLLAELILKHPNTEKVKSKTRNNQ